MNLTSSWIKREVYQQRWLSDTLIAIWKTPINELDVESYINWPEARSKISVLQASSLVQIPNWMVSPIQKDIDYYRIAIVFLVGLCIYRIVILTMYNWMDWLIIYQKLIEWTLHHPGLNGSLSTKMIIGYLNRYLKKP